VIPAAVCKVDMLVAPGHPGMVLGMAQIIFGVFGRGWKVGIFPGMLTRPAGHEAEARKSEAEARHVKNNSVCMSMKTKTLF